MIVANLVPEMTTLVNEHFGGTATIYDVEREIGKSLSTSEYFETNGICRIARGHQNQAFAT
jgi:hypothetical protein